MLKGTGGGIERPGLEAGPLQAMLDVRDPEALGKGAGGAGGPCGWGGISTHSTQLFHVSGRLRVGNVILFSAPSISSNLRYRYYPRFQMSNENQSKGLTFLPQILQWSPKSMETSTEDGLR